YRNPHPPDPYPARRSSDLSHVTLLLCGLHLGIFIITVNDSVRLLLSALRFQQQAEKLYSESPQPHIFLHHNFFENIFPVTENFLDRKSTRLNSSHVKISYA